MSRFGKTVLLFLAALAAWHLCSTLFADAPPGPGGDPAEKEEVGSDAVVNASELSLAREAGVRAAAGTGRNFVVSPLSIHAALAMVAAGARGATRRELLGLLGSASLDDLHRAPAIQLVGRLNGVKQTSFACGVWVDRRRVLRPEFAASGASRYAATAESVDFASGAELARRRVNAFVADATKQRIRDVLPPGSVDSSTTVVLANALYFKGAWPEPFDVFTAPFHTPGGGATVRVPALTTDRSQQIALYPGFRALKLPYKKDAQHQRAAFYMLILLPEDSGALSLAELYDKAASTPEFIRKHTPVKEVMVRQFMVPKFKFTTEFEASSDMRKLGVTRAFAGGDFSGMVSGGDGRLSIGGVHHKATIEVDEIGTVAAAATVIGMAGSALPTERPQVVDFVADRPFLFAVVEQRTGAVLFLGHVVNPLAS